MTMQEQKISSLEQQISSLHSSSVDSEALLEELNHVKNQVKTLKISEDSLVQQIHEKDCKMENLVQELEAVKLEIIALKSSNATLTQDLNQRNQDIVNAAVEMERLREQIVQLQQDAKDVKNNTDLDASLNATTDSTLLNVEDQEALINEVSVCKREMSMQEQKISALEEQISSLRSSSVEELNLVKNQVMTLKASEDSLVQQIHEKDRKLHENVIEMEKLRDLPSHCESVTHMSSVTSGDQIDDCEPSALSLMQELEAVKSEIIALKSLNATLTKDLDDRNQEIVNAAVEMEQLREQIVQFQQDAKDVKNKTDLNSSQNAAIDTTLLNIEEQEALINEVSVCKSEMAMQEQKISALEQQISSMQSSSVHSEALLEELNDVKNQVKTLKINEDSLVQQMHERDCKLNEYVAETEKLRKQLCQSEGVADKSHVTPMEQINKCDPYVQSLIHELEDMKLKIAAVNSLNDTLTKDLAERNLAMEQLQDRILHLQQNSCDSERSMLPDVNSPSDSMLSLVEDEKNVMVTDMTLCKNEKICALEQQMHSSSVDSDTLLEELNNVKNQVKALKISEDSLVHQIHERDDKLKEYAIEVEKLRDAPCQCEQNAHSPILVPNAVNSTVDHEIVMSSVVKTDLLSLDIEKLSAKLSLLENDLHESRSLLWSNLEEVEIDESAPLHSLVLQCLSCLTETKKKCTDLELRSQGQQLQLQDKLSEELIQCRNELLAMKNDNNSLRLELDSKNSVLEDSESELRQLREKVESLKSNSSDLQKLESVSKEIVLHKNELEELRRKNSVLEDEIKFKNSLNLDVEDEVRQLKAKLHELANNLGKDEFCQKCCDLEKTIKNQLSEVESRDEKINTLQKHCEDLELEIKCAHRTLLSEVKAISDSSDDLGNVSLSELLSRFLESIMKVQKHVASVFQTKLDSCTSELQAYVQQEAEWQETMKEMKSNVAQLTEMNESLTSQLGGIKQKEESLLIVQESFENSFKKLRSLLNCTQDLSQDELLSVVQSKLIELSIKADELAELNTTVQQFKTENDSLSLKIAETEKERKELQDKLSSMEYSSDQSTKDLKDLREKYEKSVADLLAQERFVKDLQSEALHAAECIEQLEKTQKRLESISQELLTETALNATLKTELSKKSDIVLNLEASLTELQLQVQTQSKQLSGKESLQSKASSLYNDLTEKKQLIVKLKEEIGCQKSILEEKQEKIEALCKEIEELKEKQSITEGDFLKMKNERDLAVKNLTLKPSPSDEVKELKAEMEFLNQQYENALKSSRETRTQNRKIKAELTKMKEKLETSEKSTPGPSSELALLQGQLSQEISLRKQLEIQVEEQLTELSQLSRLKPSRASDFKQKREASDARNVRSELESLREKYERNLKELTSKSHEVQALMNVVKEKEEIIIEKDKKIDEINKDKEDLDKECEDLLSWGRSLDQMNKELADRIAEILKDLAQTKSKFFSVTMDKIMVLRSSCKEVMGSLDKTTGDLLEMQLSSKEKSAKNAQSRAEALIGKLNDICSKPIDCDMLQDACSELHKENQFLSDVDDEFTTIWQKVCQEKKQAVRECDGCKELLEWGKKQEALANENDNLVDRLNAEIKRLKRKEPSSLTNAHSASDKTSPKEYILKCEELQRLVQTQRTELADKNAEITELKMKQQILNKPAEDTIKRLEEKLKLSKDEIGNLKSQNRRILKTYQENTECASSSKVMTKSVHTQTAESNEAIYKSQYWSSGPSGIVDEANRIALEDKVRKLEREKETYKKLCIDRKQRMDIMEDKLKKYLKENQENEPNNSTSTPYSLRRRK
ncbi:early endosome antigen 1-like isoform X1 [Frankliniella occidentalis]|uniref:Early endosome antigen 1-like isoform X1 n=1 Tax=Frankliniella occidentalis TaxID=133901 RepID=A0A6J1SAG2_FRAOC|nr:early endosome antigen 1-like isoform X1 [Frankliniella occidentalis]